MSDLDALMEAQAAARLKPVVPLPPELSQCDCPHRPTRHYHTCRAAVAYDERPLSERADYELGRRFQGVTFELPNRLHGTLHIDVELDIEGIIRADPDAYRRFAAGVEWADWEKPLAFVWEAVTEAWTGVYFGGRRLCYDRSDFEYDNRGLGWTQEDTERIHAWLDSPASDPNQPELPL